MLEILEATNYIFFIYVYIAPSTVPGIVTAQTNYLVDQTKERQFQICNKNLKNVHFFDSR